MFYRVLIMPLDYLIYFALVLRGIYTGKSIYASQTYISSQTKNFPLFWGHTWKYNIQATEEAIKHWILCFCSLFCFLYSTVFFILILNPSLSPISTLPLLSLLYNISIILELLLLFAKHFFYIKTFPTQKFEKKCIQVIYLYSVSIFENFPLTSTTKA